MRPDVRYRLTGLAILVVIAVVLAVLIDVPSVTTPREYAGTGFAGALEFALVYAVLSLLPLPATVFTLAAGAVFGLARGLPIVVLGATLGATAAFYLGRVLGRDAVQHFTGARLQTLDRYLTRRGFRAVLAARLVPVVPFTGLNYLSGPTGVRASNYLLASVIGILPGTTAYVAAGAYGNQPGSLPFLTAVSALLLLTVVGVVVSRRRRGGVPDDTSASEQ